MSLAVPYLYLAIAIVFEVIGTTALKASDAFSKLTPTVIAVAAYAVAFLFLARAMQVIPAGIAYGIWSAFGIVLIAAAAWILFDQRLDAPAVVGLGLIILGVVVINLFSKSIGR
ncbi:MAG: SMR family transporter [Alphaproteobacteria bacterium]|nr:SMR family transporter [Alphaproteobacteria bacterium]